ncbi:DUF465 domain-containing protein [Pseudomonas sp. LS1212]|uniref:DUF465 domain-containing protein n=1 Tax=Pseudomonas sp. LS1212 TaxID=2972478 RepID=UPI00215C5D29|nr:DUF465 domain-containing protein [Pseudomonas sp. LS1212]UVJ45239.1 DUF465 domain-containing protein [Pseudomonas sp. LS1212]
MPVRHNLYEDLKRSKEEIENRRKTDPKLDTLLSKYHTVDAEVLDKESQAAADDELKKLKEKRLLIKDQIAQQLDYPNSRGAAAKF